MSKFEELMERYYSLPEAERETDYEIDLLGLAFHHAPPELKKMTDAKLKELGLLPEFSFVDDTGQAFCTAESVAKTLGVSVEEVNQRCAELKENHPEDFTPRGGLHRIQ